MEKELTIERIAVKDVGNLYYCRVDGDVERFMKGKSAALQESVCQRRKNEILTVSYLISRIAGENEQVLYNETGKPFLKNSAQKISISHSEQYAAVFLASVSCGVDVERISKRTLSVAGKYLGDSERRLIGNEMPEFYHTLFWSAKESLYKLTGLPDFKKEMTAVHLPVPGKGCFPVQVNGGGTETLYTVYYTSFDQHVLTWAYEG